MDILQVVANIAQILGVCWAILFGGKALTEIVKGKLPSPRTFTNILLAVICVVLITLLFHPTTFSNVVPSPRKSGNSVPQLTPSPTATPTPKSKVIPENLNIPCIGCEGGDYAFTLKLNTITIDYSNNQIITKFTLTNIGTTSCNVQFDKLEFQDDNGTIFIAQNVGQFLDSTAVGNSFIVNSKFDLLPQSGVHYLLSISLRCVNIINYKTEDFVFN